jgi:sulfonate transport system ATP-binding protein
VSAPHVLALDEPLGALDALTRIEMQRLVEQVWLSNGFTAILVTHDVTEAVALGDRIVLIGHGAIAADIPVDLARPRRRGSPDSPAWKRQFLNISLRRQTRLRQGSRPSNPCRCVDLRLRVF